MSITSKMYGSFETVKKLAVCAVLVFACISVNAETKEFDKLSKIKDVDVTHVNKDMIKLAAQTGTGIHLGETINLDDESGEILNTINEIKVFHCEKKKAMEELKNKTLKLLKNKKWNPLIDTKSDEGQIKIYQAKEGEKNTNVVFVMQEDEAVVVVIDGTFDITKMMGMDNDDNDEDEEEGDEEEGDEEEQD